MKQLQVPRAARLLVAGSAVGSRRSSSRTAAGPPIRDRRRRGSLLMEMIAASALFGILLTIVVPVVTGVAAVRESARAQQAAHFELDNIMEQMAARREKGERLREVASALQVSQELALLLPEARLSVDVAETADATGAVRVSARLAWPTGTGRPEASAELHAYFVEAVTREEPQP